MGQSPYQIITNHPELEMSVRALYTYINDGLFCSGNINPIRKVKFKDRKCHHTQIKTVPCSKDVPGLIFSRWVLLPLPRWTPTIQHRALIRHRSHSS